jgi:hypothetical protein
MIQQQAQGDESWLKDVDLSKKTKYSLLIKGLG